MKRLGVIAVLVVLAIGAFIALGVFRSRSFATRVRDVKVGDTREQVVATLGPATEVFMAPKDIRSALLFGPRVETWAYGRRFDWKHSIHSKFPFFWPVRFRLFGPAADDVAVEFDSNGRVRRVLTPST